MFSFTIDKTLHRARLSTLTTPHGAIKGPFFQFVATRAAIRGGIFPEDLTAMGVQIVLANTYHLHLQPGEDTVAQAGGLHGFMQWDGPITTDSGGYQVFSLGDNVKLDVDGVTFKSHLDGSKLRLTPESAMEIQHKLGADIIMPLDVCTEFGASREVVAAAVDQTFEWAKRCKIHHDMLQEKRTSSLPTRKDPASLFAALGLDSPAPGGIHARSASNTAREESFSPSQALYGIVQGGVYSDLRERSAEQLRSLDFFGYSIGGELQEGGEKRIEELALATAKLLPEEKPRYLMGYGTPEDIVGAVRAGVDHFDCVLPIRNARHGQLFYNLNKEYIARCLAEPDMLIDPGKMYTKVDITKAPFKNDHTPFSPGHPVIKKPYTKSYVHHLLRAEAPSGYRLAVLHNIYFYVQLMQAIRGAVEYTK